MKFKRVERILLAIGLALLTVWVVGRLHGAIGCRTAIAEVKAENTAAPSNRTFALPDSVLGVPVDFRLWSVKRILAYQGSLTRKTDAPLAILRIPKIGLEAPVFNDTDDLTLNRGVGRILGTAQIGKPGNLGIAGHRDGFFRGLQNMASGDVVELIRPRQTDRYAVSEIRIVAPEDTHVLDPTPVPTLTLVTCFPFYFIGHAPKRYIVTAPLDSARASDNGTERRRPFSEAGIPNDKEKKR